MRVVIANLDAIEGYVSVTPEGGFKTEAADPTDQKKFAGEVRTLYRFYQATRKLRLTPLQFLTILPTWLKSQTYAYVENPQPRTKRRKPSLMQQRKAKLAAQ